MTKEDDKKATEPVKTEDAVNTEDAEKSETAKSGDEAKSKDEKIGQEASTMTGKNIPVSDDEDKKTAQTLGTADGKAGTDDAAKPSGKADGEAEDEDQDAFVSPEDGPKARWEAKVEAFRRYEPNGPTSKDKFLLSK